MQSFKEGQIINYEGRVCLITKLTDTSATLKNTSPKSDNDWVSLEVNLLTLESEE